MDKSLMRAYTAELIGTFALVFLGAGAVCVNAMTKQTELRPGVVGIALAHGLIYAVALSVTLHISGGFLNPAVTLMLWSFNRLDTARMAWYLGAQLLGAALAGLCLYTMFDISVLKDSHAGTPHVNLAAFGVKSPDWDIILFGTGIELALTFFLVLAIFGTILDTQGQRITGLMVGLALAADMLMAFPLTGAAVNPARWFGTVFWERLEQTQTAANELSPFADMFVYMAGPILGALLAGLFYHKVVVPADRSQGVLDMPEPPGKKK
jgi:aquaporin Z